MSRTFKGSLLLLALVGAYQAAAFANGSSIPSSPASASSKMPSAEERAVESYNNGIEHKDKGRKLEEQAAATQGAEAAKLAAAAGRARGPDSGPAAQNRQARSSKSTNPNCRLAPITSRSA